MTLADADRAFAERHRVARLATADAAATPHVIPICYALLGDCFYFIVDEKPKRRRAGLKRLRNIRENPRVAMVIDDYDEEWNRLAFLLISGEAAIVRDAAEFARGLDALRRRYPQYCSMDLRRETHPMVRITPRHCHAWQAAARGL
jgi:PPOX class probable F420-dependent enzyme